MTHFRLGETQQRILNHVKRRGDSTVPELADALGINVETARSHLRALRAEGLIGRKGSRSKGVGRPEIVYALTDEAEGLFPDRAGRMLADLVDFLRREGDEGSLTTFFAEQGDARTSRAMAALDGIEGRARVRRLAELLTDEGFMAQVDEGPEGELLLRLSNCPIRKLIDVTEAPCRAELSSISRALDARLRRVSHIPEGHAACCYRIEFREPATDRV